MTVSRPLGQDHRQKQTMSLRLPRPVHERMKALAARRGTRAADAYVQAVSAFIRNRLATHPHIFAVENDAVHITISIPETFAQDVRDAARTRRVTANELIYTAVSCELESPDPTSESDEPGTGIQTTRHRTPDLLANPANLAR